LTSLDLSALNLSGNSMPTELGKISTLSWLNLYLCDLKGTVPSGFGDILSKNPKAVFYLGGNPKLEPSNSIGTLYAWAFDASVVSAYKTWKTTKRAFIPSEEAAKELSSCEINLLATASNAFPILLGCQTALTPYCRSESISDCQSAYQMIIQKSFYKGLEKCAYWKNPNDCGFAKSAVNAYLASVYNEPALSAARVYSDTLVNIISSETGLKSLTS